MAHQKRVFGVPFVPRVINCINQTFFFVIFDIDFLAPSFIMYPRFLVLTILALLCVFVSAQPVSDSTRVKKLKQYKMLRPNMKLARVSE